MAKKNQAPEQPPRERIHRGWMLLLLLFGVVLTGAAFPSKMLWGWLDAGSTTVVQSILVSFGVALISAGVLFIFEPKLRKAVQKTTESAVQNATESIREDILTEVKSDVESRFQTLEDRMSTVISDGIAAEDSDLAKFLADFSYENVRKIMEIARSTNSLGNGAIYVDATSDPSGLKIGLDLQYPPMNYLDWRDGQAPIEEYDLKLVAKIGAETWSFARDWLTNDDVTELFEDLLKDVEANTSWGRANVIDWAGIHERLFTGINLAIKSTRQDPDSYHLQAPLNEIIGSEQLWYITTESVEQPENNWVEKLISIPRSKRPTNIFDLNKKMFRHRMDKPEWADPAVWAVLETRFMPKE